MVMDSGDFAYPAGLDWELHDFEQQSYIAFLTTHFNDPLARWADDKLAQLIRASRLSHGLLSPQFELHAAATSRCMRREAGRGRRAQECGSTIRKNPSTACGSFGRFAAAGISSTCSNVKTHSRSPAGTQSATVPTARWLSPDPHSSSNASPELSLAASSQASSPGSRRV